jgi:preprotein translocase subunit SecE
VVSRGVFEVDEGMEKKKEKKIAVNFIENFSKETRKVFVWMNESLFDKGNE